MPAVSLALPDASPRQTTAANPSAAQLLEVLKAHPALRPVAPREGRRRGLSTGLPALDTLLGGGLARGSLVELVGKTPAPVASGRTALALAVVAAASRRGEVIAWLDAHDALDVESAASAGVVLERLLWVRGRQGGGGRGVGRPTERPTERPTASTVSPKQVWRWALRATDLLLDAGGFGLIVLDLAEHRASQTSQPAPWVRLKRRLERSATVLLVLSAAPLGFTTDVRLACARLAGAKTAAARLELTLERQRHHGDVGGSISVALDSPAA